MLKNYVTSGVLALCVFALATTIVDGVPLSVLDDPTHPLNQVQQQPPPEPKEQVSLTASQPVYESGDTVFLFCQLGTRSFGSFGGTDCWGWESPDGTEYAIMGIDVGVAFVNTSNMQVADIVNGPTSNCGGTRWRDIKSYQHYCYAVSECSGTNQGLMVMDMQYLPDSVKFIGSFAISTLGDPTSHNLTIDTVEGYAYAEGAWSSSAGLSVHIISLANPENPTYVNSFGPSFGLHDIYALNDTVFLAEGDNPSFSIWNLANKAAPQLITRVTIPAAGYVHNIWPSRDRNYAVTTEETAYKTVKIWDIQDLGNIQLAGEYLAPSGLAHNAHFEQDTVFISHYESGLVIVDVTTPSTPVELGRFDTFSGEDPGFSGAWGIFPHTSSGKVYGSNMDGRLFVLEFNEYVLADTMWVDSVPGFPGGDVRVDVYASNTVPLSQIIIPVQYDGPFNLTLDSVSKAGLRTDYFEELNLIGSDAANKRKAYSLISSFFGSSPPLAPGSGPILSLYFSVGGGASGGSNPISLGPFGAFSPTFAQACINYAPDTLTGYIYIESACCQVFRGNVDGDPVDEINVADLTYLVDFLFKSGPPPSCLEEANVDGDSSEEILVSDLTFLVDYLYKGGLAPGLCPF